MSWTKNAAELAAEVKPRTSTPIPKAAIFRQDHRIHFVVGDDAKCHFSVRRGQNGYKQLDAYLTARGR